MPQITSFENQALHGVRLIVEYNASNIIAFSDLSPVLFYRSMEPVIDNSLATENKEDGTFTAAPVPIPEPVPSPAITPAPVPVSAPASASVDHITKAIRNNARHKMSAKKPVVCTSHAPIVQ